MPTYDILSEAFFADPHPLLETMQREAPCHFEPRLEAFVVTRYEDVERVLQDAKVFSSDRVRTFSQNAPEEVRDKLEFFHWQLEQMLVFTDPPLHTRLRTWLGGAINPGFLAQARAATMEIVPEALDELEAVDDPDLVRDYAHPVPTRVLTRVLGVDRGEIPMFTKWTKDLFAVASGLTSAEVVEAGYNGVMSMREFVRELLRDRRASPRDDILTALTREEVIDGVPTMLSEDDVIALYMVLFTTGHQSTTNFVGSALRAILSDAPSRAAILADDLGKDPMSELVRMEAPFMSLVRKVVEDTVIAGTEVKKGQFVYAILTASNRDPSIYTNPHRIDFFRKQARHFGFGTGIHSCLGATMAKAVAEESVFQFVRRFPTAEIDRARTSWVPSISTRGLAACPVKLRPHA